MNRFICPECNKVIEDNTVCITKKGNFYHNTCVISTEEDACINEVEDRISKKRKILLDYGIDKSLVKTLEKYYREDRSWLFEELCEVCTSNPEWLIIFKTDDNEFSVDTYDSIDCVKDGVLEGECEEWYTYKIYFNGVEKSLTFHM